MQDLASSTVLLLTANCPNLRQILMHAILRKRCVLCCKALISSRHSGTATTWVFGCIQKKIQPLLSCDLRLQG